MNVDYKIASKAIAKKIEPILNKRVHSGQTGFVKGRYIEENIGLISDIMEQTKKKLNSTGVLISVDFQRAFDSLEWSCIQSALEGYNFGEGIVLGIWGVSSPLRRLTCNDTPQVAVGSLAGAGVGWLAGPLLDVRHPVVQLFRGRPLGLLPSNFPSNTVVKMLFFLLIWPKYR